MKSTLDQSTNWMVRPADATAEVRLLCFPFAGAGASSFRQWPTKIGDVVDVCPIQLPGKENRIREKPYADFDTFADDAVAALAPWLDRPYAVFGHCMGALLAYAFTKAVEQSDLPNPIRLFASGSLIPSRGFYGVYRPEMSDEQIFAELQQAVRVAGSELDPELQDFAVRILRADMAMCQGYRPGHATMTVPVTAIAWRDDPDVGLEDAQEWGSVAASSAHLLDGGNVEVVTAPKPLIDLIRWDLDA